MTTLIKICGLTRAHDVEEVARAGADFIGLNLWDRSKRHVAVPAAKVLAEVARAHGAAIRVVGLFVDAAIDEIADAVAEIDLDIVQLHGDEDPARCAEVSARTGRAVWKAVPVAGPDDVRDLSRWPVEAVLFDAPSAGRGGSGKTIDWDVAAAARGAGHVVLAGGLDAANVGEAIRRVRPWAVDVASGVELAPGIKDAKKVAAFVAAARALDD